MQKRLEPLNLKTKPLEYIDWLYANTYYKNGSIFIGGLGYKEHGREHVRCFLKWNENDLNNIKHKYSELLKNIGQISDIYKKLSSENNQDIERIMKSNGLFDFWNTFIKPFNYEQVTLNKILDIADKMETIKEIQRIEHELWANKSLNLDERELYNDCKDLKISDDELKIYLNYWNSFKIDCENRVGKAPFAMDLVLRARRVCKILEIGAPESVVYHEERALAAALIIHNYAVEAEFVDRTACLNEINADFFERDEEKDKKYLDYLYLLI